MTITYTWKISEIECAPRQGDLADVATTIHWRLDGTDGNHFSGVYGATSLESPVDGNFTEFENLTEEQVLNWVTTALGDNVDAYKEKIKKEIDQLSTPVVVSKAPPWLPVPPNGN